MNLRELTQLIIDKALEYVDDSDHESYFEELVDAAVMAGMDREDLYGINSQFDKFLKIGDEPDDDDEDSDAYRELEY